MKNWSVLFACLLLSLITQAQSISGNVRMDSTTTALRYGNVDIYKNDKLVASVLTDRLGNFTVALDTGKYVCVINYAGFLTEKREITVTGDERADIGMSEDPKAIKRSPSKIDYEGIDSEGAGEVSEIAITSSDARKLKGIKRESIVASYKTVSSPEFAYDDVSSSSGRAGALTAGEINDFSKWELWQNYSKNELNAYQKSWELAPSGRYTLMLQSKTGLPLADALVKLLVANNIVFTSRTDNTGKAELWLTIKDEKPVIDGKLSLEVEYNGKTTKINKVDVFEKGINHLALNVSCQDIENVDVAFVVDATGSMGDEISYLQAELSDIIFQSKAISSKLNFRFANVFYRDQGDAYVTKSMNFNRILTEATAFINEQRAGGGGDYEEAVEVALDSAINALNWSESARARILFLVLDAPPHNTAVNRGKLEVLVKQAAAKGIRIVPIGASGINKNTEYLLRALAIGTNGTYTFLSNHSGIGNAHIEPTTDEYDVETLNALMIRILKSYTYMPDCEQQLPELNLNYPDSLVSNVPKKDSADTVSTDPKKPEIRWSYYPNPTNGILHIVSDSDIDELYLTDLSGKVLQSVQKLEKNRVHQLDLSTYPTGIYLIRYRDGENWLSGKVVLQRTS